MTNESQTNESRPIEIDPATVTVIAADASVAKSAATATMNFPAKDCLPGIRTSFYHAVKEAPIRVRDLLANDGLRLVQLLVGTATIDVPDGASFSDVAPEGLVASSGQFFTPVFRNMTEAKIVGAVTIVYEPLPASDNPVVAAPSPRIGAGGPGAPAPRVGPAQGGGGRGGPSGIRIGAGGGRHGPAPRRVVGSLVNRPAVGSVPEAAPAVRAPETRRAPTANVDAPLPIEHAAGAPTRRLGAIDGAAPMRRTIEPTAQRSASLSPTTPIVRGSGGLERIAAPALEEEQTIVRIERFRMPAVRDLAKRGAPLPPAHHGAFMKALRGGDPLPGDPYVMTKALAERIADSLMRGPRLDETERAAFVVAVTRSASASATSAEGAIAETGSAEAAP